MGEVFPLPGRLELRMPSSEGLRPPLQVSIALEEIEGLDVEETCELAHEKLDQVLDILFRHDRGVMP